MINLSSYFSFGFSFLEEDRDNRYEILKFFFLGWLPKGPYNDTEYRRLTATTHMITLDHQASINSPLYDHLIVGLSLTMPHQESMENTMCDTGSDVAKKLLWSEQAHWVRHGSTSMVAQETKGRHGRSVLNKNKK